MPYFILLMGDFEALASPNACDPLVIGELTIRTQKSCDPLVAVMVISIG